MEKNKVSRKQIVFNIHPDVHKQVKILAARRGITMNCWFMRAIYDRLAKENRSHEVNDIDKA